MEYIMQLSNMVGAHPWLTVHHLADDDYVMNLAQFVRDNLRQDLVVYVVSSPKRHKFLERTLRGLGSFQGSTLVAPSHDPMTLGCDARLSTLLCHSSLHLPQEHSNEVWNRMFAQFTYASNAGKALWGSAVDDYTAAYR